MLIKQVQFRSYGAGSRLVQPLVGEGLEKLASAENRSKLHPRLQDFVRSVRKTDKGIYVLVSALGAGEYYSSNTNGDLFPERSLVHAPENWDQLSQEQQREVAKTWRYGYPTFMNAHPFTHHQNKDPSRAFGWVELAVWNPDMHRVELVCYLDRKLAEKFGASHIIDKIDAGGFPDVSMGTRVPSDFCNLCWHESKTQKDYCFHLKNWLNRILPDGRKVCAVNLFPRFFDISWVFIGADKIAKTMAKLAQQGNQFCLGSFCAVPRPSAEVGALFSKEAEASPWETLAAKGVEQILNTDTRKYPIKKVVKLVHQIADTVKSPTPPEMEKTAGKVKRQTTFNGLAMKLEYDPGDYREGVDKETGKKWRKVMHASYGYIPKTEGDDGEAVDVYLRKNPEPSSGIFVVHQKKKDGSHDEDKLMFGFDDIGQAESIFKKHVPSWAFGSIEPISDKQFSHYLGGVEKTAFVQRHPGAYNTMRHDPETDRYYSVDDLNRAGTSLRAMQFMTPKELAEYQARDDRESVRTLKGGALGAGIGTLLGLVGRGKSHPLISGGTAGLIGGTLGALGGNLYHRNLEAHKQDQLLREAGSRDPLIPIRDRLTKTASVCSCHGTCDPCRQTLLEKTAGVFMYGDKEKRGAFRKISEILKQVPLGAGSANTSLPCHNEDIPADVLNQMACKGLGPALSTSGLMGIVLKPKEFQRTLLVGMGDKSLADQLDHQGCVFPESSEVNSQLPISPHLVDDSIKSLLMNFLGSRSVGSPTVRIKIIKMMAVPHPDPQKAEVPENATPDTEALMKKMGSIYNGYRLSLIKEAASIERNLVLDPELRECTHGPSLALAFANGIEKTASERVLGSDSLAYLAGAYYSKGNPIVGSLAQLGARHGFQD